MKRITSLLIGIILLSGCSNTSSTETGISSIEPTEEWSERIMPHLIEMDKSQFRFTKETYQQINDLLSVTLKIEQDGEKNLSDPNNFNDLIDKTDQLMNEMGDLEHDSYSVLMEYSHPLRELVDEISTAQTVEALSEVNRKIQVYLLNFRQLFPEN